MLKQLLLFIYSAVVAKLIRKQIHDFSNHDISYHAYKTLVNQERFKMHGFYSQKD